MSLTTLMEDAHDDGYAEGKGDGKIETSACRWSRLLRERTSLRIRFAKFFRHYPPFLRMVPQF